MCVNHRNLLHFLVGQELRAIAIKKHNKQSLEAIACCYCKFGIAISERIDKANFLSETNRAKNHHK